MFIHKHEHTFSLANPELSSFTAHCVDNSYSYRHVVDKCNEWVTKPNCHGKVPLAKFVIHYTFVRNLAKPTTKPMDLKKTWRGWLVQQHVA